MPACNKCAGLQQQLAAHVQTIREVSHNSLPCGICNKPVIFEFTVENSQWNRIVRAKELPEYLCFWCFDDLAAKDGETVRIGVNIVGTATRSGWCCDDVPGAYPNEVTKAQLQQTIREREEQLAKMREALEGLVERLDFVHNDSQYRAVWTM